VKESYRAALRAMMKPITNPISRRDFIKRSAESSLAAAAAFPLKNAVTEPPCTSTVVLVRDTDVLTSDQGTKAEVLSRMLDTGVRALTGRDNVAEAWREIVKPHDTVGVKSNVWGPLPTPIELEQAVVKNLRAVGIEDTRISVNDRGVRRDSVFQEASALINMRPMRTHHWAGVAGCIKNYITFAQSPPRYHPDSCASLGSIWLNPQLKGKTKLNVLILLTPLFHGTGPHHYDAKYTWPYGGIVLSQDPVSVDTVGLRILEAHRRNYFGETKPLSPSAKHIALADTRYGLGVTDLNKIRLIRRGWEQGALI